MGIKQWFGIMSAVAVGQLVAMLLLFSLTNVSVETQEQTTRPAVQEQTEVLTKTETYNFGNIRKNNEKWKGEVDCPGQFKCFESPEMARRSVNVLLKTYYSKYNLTNIRDIIERYAPPQENNTDAVIDSISTISGFSSLTYIEESELDIIADAIIQLETGN